MEIGVFGWVSILIGAVMLSLLYIAWKQDHR